MSASVVSALLARLIATSTTTSGACASLSRSAPSMATSSRSRNMSMWVAEIEAAIDALTRLSARQRRPAPLEHDATPMPLDCLVPLHAVTQVAPPLQDGPDASLHVAGILTHSTQSGPASADRSVLRRLVSASFIGSVRAFFDDEVCRGQRWIELRQCVQHGLSSDVVLQLLEYGCREHAAGKHEPVPRQPTMLLSTILGRVSVSSVEMTPRAFADVQMLMAHRPVPHDAVDWHAAHAIGLTAQLPALRRTNAVEALRLWSLDAALGVAASARVVTAADRCAISTYLLRRVLEHIQRHQDPPTDGVMGHKATCSTSSKPSTEAPRWRPTPYELKPSTWDALATSSMALLPLLIHESAKHCTALEEQAFRLIAGRWVRSVHHLRGGGAYSGALKTLALVSEVQRLLPSSPRARPDGNPTTVPSRHVQHRGSIASSNSSLPVEVGRRLLLALGGNCPAAVASLSSGTHQQPASSQRDYYHPHHDRLQHHGQQSEFNEPMRQLRTLMMQYKYLFGATSSRRREVLQLAMTAIDACSVGIAAIAPASNVDDTAVKAAEGYVREALTTVHIVAAASPYVATMLVHQVLCVVSLSCRSRHAAVRVLPGFNEALGVLLPATPCRQWIYRLALVDVPPEVLHASDPPMAIDADWQKFASTAAAAMLDELPMDEVCECFLKAQGEQTLFPLPLLAFYVLHAVVALATQGGLAPGVAAPNDPRRLSAVASRFMASGLSVGRREQHALSARGGAPQMFRIAGCVHRARVVDGICRMLSADGRPSLSVDKAVSGPRQQAAAASNCDAGVERRRTATAVYDASWPTSVVLQLAHGTTKATATDDEARPPFLANMPVPVPVPVPVASWLVSACRVVAVVPPPHKLRSTLVAMLGIDAASSLSSTAMLVTDWHDGALTSPPMPLSSWRWMHLLWLHGNSPFWDLRAVMIQRLCGVGRTPLHRWDTSNLRLHRLLAAEGILQWKQVEFAHPIQDAQATSGGAASVPPSLGTSQVVLGAASSRPSPCVLASYVPHLYAVRMHCAADHTDGHHQEATYLECQRAIADLTSAWHSDTGGKRGGAYTSAIEDALCVFGYALRHAARRGGHEGQRRWTDLAVLRCADSLAMLSKPLSSGCALQGGASQGARAKASQRDSDILRCAARSSSCGATIRAALFPSTDAGFGQTGAATLPSADRLLVCASLQRIVRFEQLLDVILLSGTNDDCAVIDAYVELLDVIEGTSPSEGAAAVPSLRQHDENNIAALKDPSLLPFVPSVAHERFYDALRRRGEWARATSIAWRWGSISEAFLTAHRANATEDRRSSVQSAIVAPPRLCGTSLSLPPSAIGSIAMSCFAARVPLPEHIRTLLAQRRALQ